MSDKDKLLERTTKKIHKTLPTARIEITNLPDLPLIRLTLLSADFHTGSLESEVMQAAISQPALLG